MNTNVVVLTGRLVRTAQLKDFDQGSNLTLFSIAVQERHRSKSNPDEWVDHACFFDCKMFGKYGKAPLPYLTKGREITITGRLHQDVWKTEERTRSKVVVYVDNVSLHSAPKGQQDAPQAESPVAEVAESEYGSTDFPPDDEELF